MTSQTQVSAGNSEFVEDAPHTLGVVEGLETSFKKKGKRGLWSALKWFHYRFFFDRYAYACFGALFLQQLIIASSTLWAVLFAEDIDAGANFTLPLILYLASLVLPYLPEALAMVHCCQWKQNAFAQFIKRFIALRQHDPVNWNNQVNREATVAVLNSEGQATLTAMADHVYNSVFYFFSALLNITAIAVLIDMKFAVGYLISLISIYLVMKWQGGKQTLLAERAQNARVKLGHSLLTVWDNVLLGNRYSFNLWVKQMAVRLQKTNRLNLVCVIFTQWLTFLVSLLIFLPSIAVTVYLVIDHINQVESLTALLLVLPRLFLTLGYTQLIFSYFAQWNVHKAKLKWIEEMLRPPEVEIHALKERIDWSRLSFTPELPQPLRQGLSSRGLFKTTQTGFDQLYPAGRYTVRGDNGSGKSTVLMLIKRHVKEQAFYLPAKLHLAFIANGMKMSTGEMLKRQLIEIKENVNVKVILLDEWDAHLDGKNCEELSSLISELAKERCVIEVRHRL